ncbi:MAG: hypothetical protein ABJE95_12670 [Byssovorax sp.]
MFATLVAVTLAACSPKATAPGLGSRVDGGSTTTADPTTSAGGAGSGAGPSWTCSGDAAYRATSTAFTSPTAAPLASALDELVYAYDARPLSIVLHQEGYSRLGAASATTDQGAAQVFAVPAPPLGALDETEEGFGNLTPQTAGLLTLVDTQGPVTIALEQIQWRARPDEGCHSIWVAFDAVIPASEGATMLHLPSGTASLDALAGEVGAPDGGLAGYPIHAWFLGESMSFDFTSLPESP